jgi:hypothetical protein
MNDAKVVSSSLLRVSEPWLDWWRDAVAWGCGMAAVGIWCDARQSRKAWLGDLTRTMDHYMRSRPFRELMGFGFRSTFGSHQLTSSTRLR